MSLLLKPGPKSTQGDYERPEAPDATDPQNNRESLFAAILLALFLHLLLYWVSPSELFDSSIDRSETSPNFEVIIEPIPEEAEMEERYVRAAPNVTETLPEETLNISDRDQQAAQEEEAPPDPENTPYIEGEEEESNRLVQGNPMQEPTPQSPPEASQSQGSSPMAQQEAAPREQPAENNPDYIEQLPKEDAGVASIEKPADSREQPEEPVDLRDPVAATSELDGRGEAQITTPPQASGEEGPKPRPRQRVERDTSFEPVKDNRQGAIQIGRLSFDAEYSEFGEYWRRVAEIIEARWRNLVYNTRSIPFGGYRVVVNFAITRKGEIRNVEVSFSNAGRLAETISVDAIVGEAPFFDWTPEMILKMGEEAGAAIHFYY